eukprot:SAG31_NODE_5847_length_2298_cov_1.515689_2_plen_43_part_01
MHTDTAICEGNKLSTLISYLQLVLAYIVLEHYCTFSGTVLYIS